MFDNYTLYEMHEREMDKRKNNVCEENMTVQELIERILSPMIADDTMISIYEGPCLLDGGKWLQFTSKYDLYKVFAMEYTLASDEYGDYINELIIYV